MFEGGADVRLRTEDGLQLTAWWAPAIGSARGVTVLVAPGNAGSRARRVPLTRVLTGRGFNVLLVEYRGYGGNPGTPTEDGLAADVRAAYQYLTEDRGVNPHRLVLFGESLGGAVLTRLATERPVGGLVLRSPFTSLADAGARAYPSSRSECSCVSGIRCASRSTRGIHSATSACGHRRRGYCSPATTCCPPSHRRSPSSAASTRTRCAAT